jgi:hypothetical protein
MRRTGCGFYVFSGFHNQYPLILSVPYSLFIHLSNSFFQNLVDIVCFPEEDELTLGLLKFRPVMMCKIGVFFGEAEKVISSGQRLCWVVFFPKNHVGGDLDQVVLIHPVGGFPVKDAEMAP